MKTFGAVLVGLFLLAAVAVVLAPFIKPGLDPKVTAHLKATETSIAAGASTMLIWQTTGADEVTLDRFGPVPPSGSKTVSPERDTTFRLTAVGPGGVTEKDSVEVRVTATPPAPSAPTAQLAVSHRTITRGQSVTLKWETTNATSVRLDPGLGVVDVRGSRQVTPATTTSYTLVAKGKGGPDAKDSVRVTVRRVHLPFTKQPPPVIKPKPPPRTPKPKPAATRPDR